MADNNNETRTPLLLGVAWTMTSLVFVFVGMRFFCRLRYARRLWWDDWFSLLAGFFGLCMAIAWTIYASLGGTQHVWFLSPEQVVNASRVNWISQPFCVGGLMAGKVAVALLIGRLQAPCLWRTWLLWIMLGAMCIYDAAEIVIFFAQCSPTWVLWNPTAAPPGAHCLSPSVLVVNGMIASSYMAFIDLALVAIPVQMIWSLHMPLKRKLGVCMLLSTGIIAFCFAILKILALDEDEAQSDLLWNNVPLLIWNCVEVNVVTIASCVPTVLPLFDGVSRRAASAKNYYTKSQSDRRRPQGRRMRTFWSTLGTHNESEDGIVNVEGSQGVAGWSTMYAPPRNDGGAPWGGIEVRREVELKESKVEDEV